LLLNGWSLFRGWQVGMRWTPNKVTMLRVVVGFAAVNPSAELVNFARTLGWPVLHWEAKESLTQRRKVCREVPKRKKHHSAME